MIAWSAKQCRYKLHECATSGLFSSFRTAIQQAMDKDWTVADLDSSVTSSFVSYDNDTRRKFANNKVRTESQSCKRILPTTFVLGSAMRQLPFCSNTVEIVKLKFEKSQSSTYRFRSCFGRGWSTWNSLMIRLDQEAPFIQRKMQKCIHPYNFQALSVSHTNFCSLLFKVRGQFATGRLLPFSLFWNRIPD